MNHHSSSGSGGKSVGKTPGSKASIKDKTPISNKSGGASFGSSIKKNPVSSIKKPEIKKK